MRLFGRLIGSVCLAQVVLAGVDLGWRNDLDLTHFVTRPEIKVPILDVKIYDEAAVMPGMWFVGAYTELEQQAYPRKFYQVCQTGPAIYDLKGELVWSGACKVKNQNTCDFRVFEHNGNQYMSAILHKYMNDRKGHAVVMNNHYENIAEITTPILHRMFNMHELKMRVADGRWTAMYLTIQVQLEDVRDLEYNGMEEGFVGDTGFHEIDMETGELLFEWWALDHIPLTEGRTPKDRLKGPYPDSWNWFHANSIDKNEDGDYLICSRFTDAIFKISGEDGHVIWQLGGGNSDFELSGFNFSRQHDAQWVSYDENKEVISFLDNAADTQARTSDTSSALFVELDKTAHPPTARVLQRIWRPDGKLTEARGNFQRFGSHSDNVVVSWSEDGYITEHDKAGKMLLETRFRSDRMVTYRSYKFNFTGAPIDPPDVKVFAFGESAETALTIAYVSWNGATEVASWRFYGSKSVLLGTVPKTGFETVFQKQGYHKAIYAEALDFDGVVLGKSKPCKVEAKWADSETSGRRGKSGTGKDEL